jgi:hypothetical protein
MDYVIKETLSTALTGRYKNGNGIQNFKLPPNNCSSYQKDRTVDVEKSEEIRKEQDLQETGGLGTRNPRQREKEARKDC